MTRVIAGLFGGRRLHTPKGALTRPTSDRTREALFSSLVARGVLDGARVLDLFAGSGALGIEAISRGAASAVLVARDRGAVSAMKRSLADLGLRSARVVSRDVLAFVGGPPEPFDLVFLDPPYDLDEELLGRILDRLTAGWLAEDNLVIVERSARSPQPSWSAGMALQQTRTYGDTVIHLAEARR